MWLDVWLAYNQPLLKLAQERGFPVIDFDLPGEQYQLRLQAIIADLRLGAPGPEAEFFDPSLRTSQRQRPPKMALPKEVARVHAGLVELAAKQASSAAQDVSPQ